MTPADRKAPTLREHFRAMCRARAFELLLLELWEAGAISGEMHMGTGEEAVAAGVVPHLADGDGFALDHRPTPFLLLRGVDPVLMVREMLGRPDGLGGGMGGHMHLFSRPHLAASSGIVGASAPLGSGFALAAARILYGFLDLEVLDLRGSRPIDTSAVVDSVRRSGRLLVVDEDYRECGLSRELAAVCAEVDLCFRYRRVATGSTIPYDRERERRTLPSVDRIVEAARSME